MAKQPALSPTEYVIYPRGPRAITLEFGRCCHIKHVSECLVIEAEKVGKKAYTEFNNISLVAEKGATADSVVWYYWMVQRSKELESRWRPPSRRLW
jgi:hypothetical protein